MTQVIFMRTVTRGTTGGSDNSNNAGASYTALRGHKWWGPLNANAEFLGSTPWSAAGTFQKLSVSLYAAITVDITVVLRVNGVDTGITATITAGTLAATDLTHTAAITAGQTVTFKRTWSNVGNPPSISTTDTYLAISFVPTTTGASGYCQASDDVAVDGASTYYIGPWNAGHAWYLVPAPTPAAPIPNVSAVTVVAAAGTLTRIDARLLDAPGGATARVFTCFKNGIVQDGTAGSVDTRLTITGASTSGSATFTLALVATDVLTVRETVTGAPTATRITLSTAFTATVDGQYNLAFDTRGAQPSPTLTDVTSEQELGWGQTSYAGLPQAEVAMFTPSGSDTFRVAGMHVWTATSNAAVVGSGYTFTTRKNLAATSLGSVFIDTGSVPSGTVIRGQTNTGLVDYTLVTDQYTFGSVPTLGASQPPTVYVGWTYLLTAIPSTAGTGGGIAGATCPSLT